MSTEFVTDNHPPYVLNKHTTYENTVLQEHSSIVSGLRETSAVEALVEAQGRMYIGLCMKDKADKFIAKHQDAYYTEEYNKLPNTMNTGDRRSNAYNRAWWRLINEATSYFLSKYKADGSRRAFAAIDDITSDGRYIIDIRDIPSQVQEYLDQMPPFMKEFYRTLPLRANNNYTPKIEDDEEKEVVFTDEE
jgi:hypothetical protein